MTSELSTRPADAYGPETSDAHLEQNCHAAVIGLTDAEIAELTGEHRR
jgi:hypothetical protein